MVISQLLRVRHWEGQVNGVTSFGVNRPKIGKWDYLCWALLLRQEILEGSGSMIQVLFNGSYLIPQEISVNKQDCLALGTFRSPLWMNLRGSPRQRKAGLHVRAKHGNKAKPQPGSSNRNFLGLTDQEVSLPWLPECPRRFTHLHKHTHTLSLHRQFTQHLYIKINFQTLSLLCCYF